MNELSYSALARPLVADVNRKPIDLRKFRRVASPLAVLAMWQIGSWTGLIPAQKLASPAIILTALWNITASGELGHHLAISLARVSLGLIIGASSGVALAIVVGLSRFADDVIDPMLQALRALPYLGMAPLLILWFGIGELPKLVLVAYASAFPVYMTLLGGIRAVDPKLVEAARIFGLRHWETVWHVILPSALAPALVGLRYSVGAAWLSLVVSEQLNADSGIGYLIMDARDFLRTDIIIVGLLVYAMLGLATDAIVRLMERRALLWRPVISRDR